MGLSLFNHIRPDLKLNANVILVPTNLILDVIFAIVTSTCQYFFFNLDEALGRVDNSALEDELEDSIDHFSLECGEDFALLLNCIKFEISDKIQTFFNSFGGFGTILFDFTA